MQNPAITAIVLPLLRRVLSVCENTSNSGLWLALGISRSNIHVFLDRVAMECTSEIVTEEVVKSLLVDIVETELLEENGRNTRTKGWV